MGARQPKTIPRLWGSTAADIGSRNCAGTVVLNAGTFETVHGSEATKFGADAVDPLFLFPDWIAKIDIVLIRDRTGTGANGAADKSAFDRCPE